MAKAFKSINKIKEQSSTPIDEQKIHHFINNATGDFENAELNNRQINHTESKKPKGRPKSNTESKMQKTIYLTKEQNDIINKASSELGMSINNYMIYILFRKEELFSNEDLGELLLRARACGKGLKDYLKQELNLK